LDAASTRVPVQKNKDSADSEAGVINAWAFLSFAQTEKNRRPEEDGEKAH